MWNNVVEFAANHPLWATFFGLWGCAILFGIGCDIVHALRGEPHVISSTGGRSIWEDEV